MIKHANILGIAAAEPAARSIVEANAADFLLQLRRVCGHGASNTEVLAWMRKLNEEYQLGVDLTAKKKEL